jgi:endonuclease/exonuclease/phosphatase family metal-dependent hydrolase
MKRLALLLAPLLLTALAHAAAPTELRVMSFNIRYGAADDGPNAWEARRDLLLRTIRDFAPDLLATQECLAEQAQFLTDSLPGYGFVGVGRDDGHRGGEMCLILYRRDRFSSMREGHFWLSETPGIIGSRGWDAALPRIASWVVLRSKADPTRGVCFLDTHLDNAGARARLQSARLIVRRIGRIAGGRPVVIAGDFNAPAAPDSVGPYAVLTAAELVDSYRARHAPAPGEGTYHAFAGKRDGDRVDWILASKDLTPIDAAIVHTEANGRYPSDHFPVTAVFRW